MKRPYPKESVVFWLSAVYLMVFCNLAVLILGWPSRPTLKQVVILSGIGFLLALFEAAREDLVVKRWIRKKAARRRNQVSLVKAWGYLAANTMIFPVYFLGFFWLLLIWNPSGWDADRWLHTLIFALLIGLYDSFSKTPILDGIRSLCRQVMTKISR
ncbi:hypothetical protein [Saccharospirillum salsuginis]|uniref:Uncharacterized protein n=1 Tax=Saccharospirillum salsuginis TaxID=418750 RepID=A0A918K1A3_9GAMM|nr:hypothetical protein [Saccharospirillum salsuginis]GGX43770.1 hypothetical protein GCM10007392_08150 [Saccharospirillum salsuginis]